MKKTLTLLLSLIISFQLFSAEKKAFIVAISDFKNGFRHLNCANDLKMLQETLSKQGFNSITALQDSQATKSAIEKNMDHFIRHDLHPGDVVYLHFSTHGVQVQDLGGDEVDGFDESIIAWDSEKDYKANPQKAIASFITDDSIGAFIQRIRTKLGTAGDLIVAIDACHSGTGYRGDESEGDVCRGGYEPVVIPGYNPSLSRDLNNFNELSAADEAGKASFVVFSASQADLPNREFYIPKIGGIGSLSYAICKALNSLGDENNVTYQKLFEDVKIIMSPLEKTQLPAIEGSGANRKLFAGKYVRQEKYFLIDTVMPDKVIIEAGTMNKIYEGTHVAICTAGASGPEDPGKLIATGKIVSAQNFRSDVKLDSMVKVPANAWVFVTKQSFGNREVRLDISGLPKSSQDWVKSIDWAKLAPFVKFETKNPDLFLVEAGPAEEIEFNLRFPLAYYKNKGDVTPVNRTPIMDDYGLVLELSNYLQYKLLSNLQLKDSSINIEIRMYPLKPGATQILPDGNIKFNPVDTMPRQIINNTLYITEGDTVVIYAVNKGKKKAYFNVVDFEPNGKINMIFPIIGRTEVDPESDLMVKKDKVFSDVVKPVLFPVKISKPCGNEVFKVIASEDRIDLRPIFEATQRGEDTQTKGNLSVLDEFILNAAGMRGGDAVLPVSTQKSNGSTYDLNFVIQPKPKPETSVKN